jgi:hypothetical protein
MVYMTKIGETFNKKNNIYLFKPQRKMFTFLALEAPPVFQRALQTRSFFVFALFLGSILDYCLDADLDLQTPSYLDLFWVRIRNISYYKLQTLQV